MLPAPYLARSTIIIIIVQALKKIVETKLSGFQCETLCDLSWIVMVSPVRLHRLKQRRKRSSKVAMRSVFHPELRGQSTDAGDMTQALLTTTIESADVTILAHD